MKLGAKARGLSQSSVWLVVVVVVRRDDSAPTTSSSFRPEGNEESVKDLLRVVYFWN